MSQTQLSWQSAVRTNGPFGATVRWGGAAAAMVLVTAACTTVGTVSTTLPDQPTSPRAVEAPATTSPVTTLARQPSETEGTPPVVTTEDAPPDVFEYVVVAEEQARRLSVIDPSDPCVGGVGVCDLGPVLRVELSERPHNLAGVGSVVYATHPAAGSMSRVDLATDEILTARVGVEPHDVKYVPDLDQLFVADEDGRQLLTIDPATLEVLTTIDLPGKPHDFAVSGGDIWVTLVGRPELARIVDGEVELVPTGGSPHDLLVDPGGRVWFSNWNSDVLNVFDPVDGSTEEAPAGVTQPHHFAVGPGGFVWVSDNGGNSIVGFTDGGPVSVEVGSTPHHIAVSGEIIVVAVSGSGEAVLVTDGEIVATVRLTEGLHGVATVELVGPIPGS